MRSILVHKYYNIELGLNYWHYQAVVYLWSLQYLLAYNKGTLARQGHFTRVCAVIINIYTVRPEMALADKLS